MFLEFYQKPDNTIFAITPHMDWNYLNTARLHGRGICYNFHFVK